MLGLHRVLNMAEYAWICLNMPEYAWIGLNLPERFLFYISLLQSLVFLNVWLLISTFTLNLKDVFLETHNLILSILAVSIIFGFYFRLIFLQVRFQICCYLWGLMMVGVVNHDIPYFSLLLFVAFVVKHNLDEKICEILITEFT